MGTAANKRACSRAPVNLEAALFYREAPALYGKLRDISFGGVYVQADCDTLNLNEPVTLDVFLDKDEQAEHLYSLSAIVVRKTYDGAGLKFDDFDGETVRSLRRLYQYALT
jgi:hypothetical protein